MFLVGGAVRDRLLGLPVKDRDFVVVGATPAEMLALGFVAVGRDFPVFIHPVSGEEYALARQERKTAPGHQGFAFDFSPHVSLPEDLLRRDLTVNAMAEDGDGVLHDPCGGLADLQARVLRHVSPAFVEDPLRVLRLFRFHARFAHLGFSVAEETLALCQVMVETGELAALTAERVWQECARALQARSPWCFFEGLQAVGALFVLFGEAPVDVARGALLLRGTEGLSAEQRLAVMLQDQPRAAAALEARLPLPNSFRRWLSWVGNWAEVLRHWPSAGGESRRALLQATGSLREEGEALALARILRADAAADDIAARLPALHAISPAPFIARGLQGAALGAALQDAQVDVLLADLPLKSKES